MKSFLSFLIFITLSAACFAQDACLQRAKDFFTEKEFALAEDILKQCLRQKPGDADTLISLGGVQMVLGKFAEAEQNFKIAAGVAGAGSPYIAYIYSRLGDIAMRKADLREAASYYDAALKREPANINALIGKGITEEKAGRTQEAVALFKKALAVDFTNVVARDRLIAMEPDILTQEEVLLTMKERNIIDPSATDFTIEEENLLRQMIRAEKDSGLEYLASKYGGVIPDGFVVERDSGKVYVRKMLTLTGYKDLIVQLSRDAKQLFMDRGVTPGNLFKLKNFDGKEVFDDKGILTDEGLAVYSQALRGAKAYLQPGETLPSSQREVDALAQRYIKQGYSEITESEYTFLQRETQCNETTLVKDLRARVINIDARKKRVFLLSREDTPEPFNFPYLVVLEYRRNLNENKKNQPTYSSAFGLGGGVKMKLCNKNGDLNLGGLDKRQ